MCAAFVKGAAANHSDSLYNLAILKAHGLGCDKNETEGECGQWCLLCPNLGQWLRKVKGKAIAACG